MRASKRRAADAERAHNATDLLPHQLCAVLRRRRRQARLGVLPAVHPDAVLLHAPHRAQRHRPAVEQASNADNSIIDSWVLHQEKHGAFRNVSAAVGFGYFFDGATPLAYAKFNTSANAVVAAGEWLQAPCHAQACDSGY